MSSESEQKKRVDAFLREKLEIARELQKLTSPTASEVQDFCGSCECLLEDGGCKISFPSFSDLSSLQYERPTSWTDQERYVYRKWCGYAIVDGVHGDMTGDGFVPKGTQLRDPSQGDT